MNRMGDLRHSGLVFQQLPEVWNELVQRDSQKIGSVWPKDRFTPIVVIGYA